MKIVSQLDAYGFFVSPVVADESPLEDGVFLIPAGAIDVPPPEFEAKIHHKIKWDGGQFIEVENAKPVEPELQAGETLQFDESAWDWVVIPAPAPEPEPAVEPTPLTPEQIQAQSNAEARAYLNNTDWYVTRFAETGVAIPADILSARQAARESIIEVAA